NLPSRASLSLITRSPARTRCRIIERSNSAKAPVILTPAGILEHPVEPGTLFAALGAADASVAVNLDHGPATTLRDLDELPLIQNHLFTYNAKAVAKPFIFPAFSTPIARGFLYGPGKRITLR